MGARVVGRVSALWRYPVKSMAGQQLDAVNVTWQGFAGDRRWAFVRTDQVRSGFPWFTMRQRTEMMHLVPAFADPAHPDESGVTVTDPAGNVFDVTDPALAARLGPAVRVMKMDRGAFDWTALSLVSVQTVEAIASMAGVSPDVRRFRPNLLIDAPGEPAFWEDSWAGSTITIGGIRMRVDERDNRCMVVNIDPDTLQSDPAVLRQIAAHRQMCLGVYGSTEHRGRVALGDEVTVGES